MEMNDILNGLNSCSDDCCESAPNTSGCGPNFGGPGFGGCGGFPGGSGFGNSCGCGFGSWIWILLILFYCGCGKNFGRVGSGYGYGGGCGCGCEKKRECCCEGGNYGGFLSNCSPYLFVLVILFLCNNSFNGCGVGSGINPCNNNFGCITGC
ncbi:hypothetical protein [Clostridium saccharoperbutylacetonicum]|jgi:hypothetical protein